MNREERNFRFCDDTRTIMYDVHFTKPGYKHARCTNQRTPQLTPKEYFKRKLKGK